MASEPGPRPLERGSFGPGTAFVRNPGTGRAIRPLHMTVRSCSVALVLIAGIACRAPDGLATYPTRDIDRPYTLPDDVDTWTTRATGSYEAATRFRFVQAPDRPLRGEDVADVTPPVPLPFGYELSLSSRITLVGFILPIALRIQLLHDATSTLGMVVAVTPIRIGGARDEDEIGGALFLDHRLRLGRDVALESSIGGGASIVERTPDDAHLSVSVGPRVQLTDRVSVRPSIAFEWSKRTRWWDATVIGDHPVHVPLRLDAHWNLHRRWSAGLGYEAGTISQAPDRHEASARATYYW